MTQAAKFRGVLGGFAGTGLLVLSMVLVSYSQTNKPDSALGLAGVRHLRLATDSFAVDTSNTNALFRIVPLTLGGVSIRAEMMGVSKSSATAEAEAINAVAMKDYQRRFESHLRNPQAIPVPCLYPSQVQRIVEQLK